MQVGLRQMGRRTVDASDEVDLLAHLGLLRLVDAVRRPSAVRSLFGRSPLMLPVELLL